MILNALFETSNTVQPASDTAIDVPSLLRSLDEQHRCLQSQILVRACLRLLHACYHRLCFWRFQAQGIY